MTSKNNTKKPLDTKTNKIMQYAQKIDQDQAIVIGSEANEKASTPSQTNDEPIESKRVILHAIFEHVALHSTFINNIQDSPFNYHTTKLVWFGILF